MACDYLFEGKWYTEKELKAKFNQLKGDGSTIPSAASAGTINKIKEFLDRIGADVKSVSEITMDGKTLGINGIADPLNGLIQVVNGKEDTVLPEEAMHLAVELIEQNDPKLFKRMMDRIGRYNLTDQVMSIYQNNPFYQKDGKPDIVKIKKEAIGKVLAQTVINKNEGVNEKPELLDQTRTWWQVILDLLKGLFLRAQFNPFEVAAVKVLNGADLGQVASLTGTPFASRNPAAVNASLKLVQSLRDPRAQKWFDTLYKKGQKDTFFAKLQQDLQAPKGQVDLLKKWINRNDPQSVGDMVTGVLAEVSYTIEVNETTRRMDNSDRRKYENFNIDGETYNYEFIIFEKIRVTDEDRGIDEYTRNGEYISRDEYEKAYAKYREVNAEVVPTQSYVGLTVPGGTNYRENEIKTPDITPTIKGHAAFATDQGIGWFRSDERVLNQEVERRENPNKKKNLIKLWGEDKRYKEILSHDITVYDDIITGNVDTYGGILIDNTTGKKYYLHQDDLEPDLSAGATDSNINNTYFGGTPTKTRRILEVQSDLFQKGREYPQLAALKGFTFPVEFEGHTYTEEPNEFVGVYFKDGKSISEDEFDQVRRRMIELEAGRSENEFLQLLNKENNWVTFFVKAIIQDSAKKGYENIRFPGGTTANKIEGQQTLDDYISFREGRISENEKKIKEIEGKPQVLPFDDDQPTYYINEEQRKQIRPLQGEIDTFKREIKEAKEGKSKFEIIAKFYETTVQNILKKQGYKPIEVTDEYGNKWFEVAVDQNRDQGEFYFQISGTADLAERIVQKNANITKKADSYEINNNKIKNSVQKEVEAFYKQRIGTNAADAFFKHYKRETESKVQVDIKDIISRRVDDDGFIRQTPLPQTNPSAVDPNDNTFYQTLDAHLDQRLSSYAPGTKFLNAQNLFDGTSTAGTPDLIAITPTGQVDILQFKAAEGSRTTGDIAVHIQQGYNIEIEAFRRILEKGYGVKRENFRYTRAIPIRVEYENLGPGFPSILDKMTIGNINVDLIKDDLLLPISSKSETSGDKKFDAYIERLRGLATKIGSERVDPSKKLERTQRVAALTSAIRKLQVKKDASKLIDSAKTIIKAQKEKYKNLVDKISNTDPAVASISELNKIAEDILSDKDQVQVYSDMHQVFKKVFTDGTVDSQEAIEEARGISEDAKDITDQYYDLSITFRTQKFAAKLGIIDEFDPEKKISWYRRMIRSLSQSSIKAGAELWELVKRINNKHKLEFLSRFEEIKAIEKRTRVWLKGKSIDELYKRIFAYDAKGRWTGKVIHKFSKQFYTDLKTAQKTKDIAWVKDNIDVPAYMVWLKEEHQKMIDNAKTARIVSDDAENARLVQQQLQDFIDTFHIDFKKGVGENNYKLKDFPLEDKWKSDAYQELEKAGNEPLLDLYKYWEKRLKESWNSGMFQEYVGWDWFPNVRRNLIEKLTSAKTPVNAGMFLGNLRIDAEDQAFGKIDPISGKPIDEVHAWFIRDLGKYVEETNGTDYFMDYSEKSMDIFKVLALWDSEIVKFNLKTESEGIARLLYFTETQRTAYETSATGKLVRREGTQEPIEISNEVNAQYIKEHIDSVYYGKKKSNEFDVTITVGDQKLSGVKLVETMNRYFVTKTLGLNVMTSFAQLFGGTLNVLINQGLYFNKKDMLDAETKYVSNKFWSSEEDKKVAGLLGYLHPFLEDRSDQQIRSLSVSDWVKHLSSDHLFFLQRGSDSWVNSIVAMAMMKNTMVVDGKLVNMREFARKELNHAGKYSGTYEQAKEFDANLEKRVEELKKSPEALINYAQIVDDKIVLPGIERTGDTVINLRQQMLEIIKDALGNTSHDDLSLYKRSIMWQSFFMFKNWIPRMFDVRFQSLKYSPGTQKYEYGRVRMLWNAVRGLGLRNTGSLLLKLGNDPKPLIEVAKEQYEKKKSIAVQEKDDFNITEAEFVDMYIKGVRSEIRELMLALGLFSILVAARAMAPDQDDDEQIKGAYRWALRGLDKLTDELTFMYTPSSFTSILNGSVFPAVGILVEIEKLLRDGFLKLFYYTIGDTEAADRKKVSKHLFRLLPVTKELMSYVAIFNDDMAKEYGIRVNTYYGSAR